MAAMRRGSLYTENISRIKRKDVSAYFGEAEQSDDFTMLGLKFFGVPLAELNE